MKIGILTQPLFTNYGGILQAYALQSVLNNMGHEAIIIRRDPPYLSTRFPNNIVLDIKYCLRILLRGASAAMSAQQLRLVSKETSRFIKYYLNSSRSLYKEKQFRNYINKHSFDAFIVGSDQVWRPAMSPNIFNFFLDFIADKDDVKRIAYAASFGVDYWEYTDAQTKVCSMLAQKFNAISVREKSGVVLCKRYLGIEAAHVLDPTILLQSKDYERIAARVDEPKREDGIFCYVLNETEGTRTLINAIKSATGLNDFYCMPTCECNLHNIIKHKQDTVFPSISKWIRSFIDAKLVFTDSFHGTAFSIIFNKPFWVIGNSARGLSRIESILESFGLQDRMVSLDKVNDTDWERGIDWERVNLQKDILQRQSMDFLKNGLGC